MAPSVWRISSVRKKALPPVAVASSACDAGVAVVQPQQLDDRLGAQGADGEPGEEPVAGQLGRHPVELRHGLVGRDAHRPDHHHPARELVAQDVLDHLERRRVGPLQVVEDDEHRVHRRLGAQQLGDGLEQQVTLDASASGRSGRVPGTSWSSSGSSRASRPRSAATRRRASSDTERSTARTASTIGSNGTIASAVARPHSTTAPSPCTSAANWAANRDLPAPGSPWRSATWLSPADVIVHTWRSRASCSDRPTNGADASRAAGPGRATGDGPGSAGPSAARRTARACSATSTGGVHELAGGASSGSWLRICGLQAGEVRCRVEAELLGQHLPGTREGPEGVDLAAAAVEGEHEAPGEALPQRVLVHRALELGDRLAVAAEVEQGVEAGLQRLEAQLLPAHHGRPGPLLVGDVGQHRPAPLGEAGVEQFEHPTGIVAGLAAGRVEEVLEAEGIDQLDARRSARSRVRPGAGTGRRRAPGAAARRSSAGC